MRPVLALVSLAIVCASSRAAHAEPEEPGMTAPEAAPPPPPAPPPPAASPPPPPAAPPPSPPPPHVSPFRRLGPQRTIALVAGGAGIVALGTGSFFGVRAIGQSDDARAMCDPAHCTSHEAIERNDDAKTSATVANVTIAAGVALVAAGVVLWLTAPRHTNAAHVAQSFRFAF